MSKTYIIIKRKNDNHTKDYDKASKALSDFIMFCQSEPENLIMKVESFGSHGLVSNIITPMELMFLAKREVEVEQEWINKLHKEWTTVPADKKEESR